MMARIEAEDPMAIDWWWGEQEYRVPSRARMERERQAYGEAERGDREIEGRGQGRMGQPSGRILDDRDRDGYRGGYRPEWEQDSMSRKGERDRTSNLMTWALMTGCPWRLQPGKRDGSHIAAVRGRTWWL